MTYVLVVDDQIGMREMLSEVLRDKGYSVDTAANAAQAYQALDAALPDLLITDLRLPDENGLHIIEKVRALDAQLPIILITAHASIDGAVEAMRQGASDYMVKPFSLKELDLRVERALAGARVGHEAERLRVELRRQFGQMVGHSEALQTIFQQVDRLARSPVSVLIRGESGTGKELLAREIHERSERRQKPFIAVNCAAIPAGLFESELFGHMRGAFTGAVRDRAGYIEQADGGTLFLDEIGDLELDAQVKLLRFLQERELRRLGETRLRKVDLRVIAATNRDLHSELNIGRFREDLFFRLAVVDLQLPPLRERKDDIPDLVTHFVRKWTTRLHRKVTHDDSFVQACLAYSWPGNVRELENSIERAVVLCDGKQLRAADLMTPRQQSGPGTAGIDVALTFKQGAASLTEQVEAFEKQLIDAALREVDGNTSRAAELLAVKRSTLQYKVQKYRLVEGAS